VGNLLCSSFSESIKVLQEYNIASLCQNTKKKNYQCSQTRGSGGL